MAQRGTITYTETAGKAAAGNTQYYLATTTDIVRFYLFDEPSSTGRTPFSLIDQLDRTRLLPAGNKATAKEWAKRLGLRSWTYVRV